MAIPRTTGWFPTSDDSPFDDKYDIAGERDALKDLIEADEPDEKDLRWPRYVELMDREEKLRRDQTNRQQRQYADPIVPDHEARALKQIGSLVADETDMMEIHTKEAYRLFIGRTRDESPRGYGITSGKKVAAVLRSIWNLSANDNPYADWILVQVTDRISELRQQIEQAGNLFQAELEKMQSRGLRVSVLKSRAPVEVELGFRSPYGYMIVDLILDYDWYARVVKTMVQRDRLGDQEGKEDLYQMTKRIRALFESTLPYQKYLLREELRQLSRSDFLPGANDDARKRVEAAVGIFGEVPQAIFTGEVRPRHSRRRADVSEAEMRLLMEVAQGKADEDGSELKQENTLL
ncbi:TIGR03761 family integrating conjugative element protein [Betaproteobacteria bacterium SCN1]|jgi:integrating conjugative element protein (TIGR03761 family)|nr:TIGR03761 family integrating conjugative element protein [Betaproteobacteria bacterium SCN1]